jgi:selenocysteine-specific elongation factor
VIIGTAGHVDHGKTALVGALTGVDTDRLPDERRRGITIDLGFAPLTLSDGRTASIVDVPGHESLVHTMIAGASGIRVALVVVAADEGVMPQTREHLRVLSALGVTRGVLALTKCDLVDAERRATVASQACEQLAASSLGDVVAIETSARDGTGLADVRAAIDACVRGVPLAPDDDLFRFTVDRAFSVRGAGTVVTGTVASGTLQPGAMVHVLPGRVESRVRGIQMHGAAVARAAPGTRAALGLAGVTPDAVPRGSVLVTEDAWTESTRLHVRVELADGAALPRTCVLHVGGTRAVARIAAGSAGKQSGPIAARITLDRPVVARRGDRFVLRATDRRDTIGGGMVLDPAPPRHVRVVPDADGSAATLSAMLAGARDSGIAWTSLPVRLGIRPSDAAACVADARAVHIADRVLSRATHDAIVSDVAARVQAWRVAHPLAQGMPLGELRDAVRRARMMTPELADALVAASVSRGDIVLRAGGVVTPRGGSVLAPATAAALARVVHRVCASGREPPSVAELTAELGPSVQELLMFAAREGNLIRVESVRYYGAEIIDGVVQELRARMLPGRAYSPSELRDIVGVSRKYLIPLLEYLDAAGVTERHSGGRIICSVFSRREVEAGSNNRSGAA